ncbi:unnamed protein product [Protopolystoma xenopodis]|uniref:Uncharacterized protein n=1 Tax=Protopolystoma xenopodis TaxID=117903 RepID=A0A448XMP6_9PLAT|nr:unnamed protein product [Protopolystoma xenopodis]
MYSEEAINNRNINANTHIAFSTSGSEDDPHNNQTGKLDLNPLMQLVRLYKLWTPSLTTRMLLVSVDITRPISSPHEETRTLNPSVMGEIQREVTQSERALCAARFYAGHLVNSKCSNMRMCSDICSSTAPDRG